MGRIKFLDFVRISPRDWTVHHLVDSRPGWDDTGITAGLILLACAGLGMAMPERAWLWALLGGQADPPGGDHPAPELRLYTGADHRFYWRLPWLCRTQSIQRLVEE